VWIPLKLGLGLTKVALAIPLDVDAEAQEARLRVYPDGMLTKIGTVVDLGARLIKKLQKWEARGM